MVFGSAFQAGALVFWEKHYKKKAMVFANLETLKRVTGKKVISKHLFVFILRMIVFIAIIFSLSQPFITYDGEEQKTDYILAIDTSASMTASDLSPTRFEAAKTAAKALPDPTAPIFASRRKGAA